MATVTNISGTPRALPLKDGTYIEFAKGETKEFPDADWAVLAKRTDVTSSFSVADVAVTDEDSSSEFDESKSDPDKPKGKAKKKDAE